MNMPIIKQRFQASHKSLFCMHKYAHSLSDVHATKLVAAYCISKISPQTMRNICTEEWVTYYPLQKIFFSYAGRVIGVFFFQLNMLEICLTAVFFKKLSCIVIQKFIDIIPARHKFVALFENLIAQISFIIFFSSPQFSMLSEG